LIFAALIVEENQKPVLQTLNSQTSTVRLMYEAKML